MRGGNWMKWGPTTSSHSLTRFFIIYTFWCLVLALSMGYFMAKDLETMETAYQPTYEDPVPPGSSEELFHSVVYIVRGLAVRGYEHAWDAWQKIAR